MLEVTLKLKTSLPMINRFGATTSSLSLPLRWAKISARVALEAASCSAGNSREVSASAPGICPSNGIGTGAVVIGISTLAD